MTQPIAIDVRAELEVTITQDPAIEDPTYRRLPPVDPEFPDVFVHNDATSGTADTWHVSCNLDFYDVDAADALALAAALTAAARQAMILNARTALSVLWPMMQAEVSNELDTHPVARLVLGVDPHGRALASFGRDHHPSTAALGSVWGDDGYFFEYVGDFRHIGREIRDGQRRDILVAVGELAGAWSTAGAVLGAGL